MKTPLSAAVDNQIADRVREIAKAQDRSVSWVVDRALRSWLGSGRPVGPDGWVEPNDGGFEDVSDHHVARLLGVTVPRLEWARRVATQAAEQHYFGKSGAPIPPPPDEPEPAPITTNPTTAGARGKRGTTQENQS